MASCPCKWEDFSKWIISYVSSPSDEFKAPTDVYIKDHVKRTAYDFAFKTGALRKKAYYDIACGVVDYPIICVEKEDILSYKSVTLNGEKLSSDQYEVRDEVLYLTDCPSCDIVEGLCVEYSYAPCTDDLCDVPQELCSRYREAVIAGTLSTLLSMPNMDWYSVGEAERQSDKYEMYIANAKVDSRKRSSSRRKNIYDIKTRFIQ